MAAMPTSSVVAWSACGPCRQRRAVVTVDDSGECRVFLSPAHAVPEGRSGEDWLCCLSMPRLCSLPPETPDLGDEVLRRLRDAGDGDGGPGAPWSDPAALPAGRAPRGPRRDAGRARAVALMLPVAVSVTISGCLAGAGPSPEPVADPAPAATGHREHVDAPMSALSFGPGPPAADVASRWHRRDRLQGPND